MKLLSTKNEFWIFRFLRLKILQVSFLLSNLIKFHGALIFFLVIVKL